MENLERIVNVLVDRAEDLRHNNDPDMSMFPKEQVPEIYTKAAERTFQKKDFESTAHYLYLGHNWDKLLELGIPLYHSESEEERKAGKYFLDSLIQHTNIPEDLAVELAEEMISKQVPDYYWAAIALNSGKAVTRAGELANQLLGDGRYDDGIRFLAVAGKKLSDDEREKYSDAALENGKPEDAFKFYSELELPIPYDKAKAMIDGKNRWLFDTVLKYVNKTGNSFTPQDFREFGDKFFDEENYYTALKVYVNAGRIIKKEEYRVLGEQILSESKRIERERTSWSGGVLPSVKIAFDYLSKHSRRKARQRIAQYADNLLEEEDFAKFGTNILHFGEIYKMIGVSIPIDTALKAAQIAEKKERYSEAAEYYMVAGMKDDAKRMGNTALQSDNDWQKRYGARDCFQAANDKEGLAIAEFLDKNLRGY